MKMHSEKSIIMAYIYMCTQFAQNSITHMKLINFLHEILAHIILHFVPKINMVIKIVGLGEGLKL